MSSKCKSALKEAGWFALKTATVSAAIYGGVAVAVPAIGFPASGLAAGSVASYYQRKYLRSCLIPGGAFSLMRKVGVKGLCVVTKVGIFAATKSATGMYTVCKRLWKKKERDENISEETKDASGEIYDSCSEEEEDQEGNMMNKTCRNTQNLNESEWEDIQWPDELKITNQS